MNWRDVGPQEEKGPWEVRAIKWLTQRLREHDDFKLRFGHSLVLEQPEPEMYMEIVYGPDEIIVFDMAFDPSVSPRMRSTMLEMEARIAEEYEEVKQDE